MTATKPAIVILNERGQKFSDRAQIKTSMPQYRYAHNEQEQIVDVLTLPADRSEPLGPFTCVGCGEPLIAKTKGEKKEKHFAHKQRVVCAPETYLHRLAKTTFYNVYKECLEQNIPFRIGRQHSKHCQRFYDLLGHECDAGIVTKKHDLTARFDGIRMEKRDDCFIPDLLIYNTKDEGQKVYIEIAVTHFLSEKKQASSNRIIEIPIETEDDITPIIDRYINEEHAAFLNLGKHLVAATDADCLCAAKEFLCFFVYESGKCCLEEGSLLYIQDKIRRNKEKTIYRKLIDPKRSPYLMSRGDLFKQLVEEAHKQGIRIRNCLLCRYEGQNWSESVTAPVYCKFRKIYCGTNEAADCKFFYFKSATSPSRP